MVATVARMASDSWYLEAQQSWRPAESGDGAPDHYVGGVEPDGIWWNPGGILGVEDRGTVDDHDFRCLYHGFEPESGEALVRNSGSEKRCPGLDVTFSADKTVSALWAIADVDLREEIAKAHNDACRTALDMFVREHCNWTRTRRWWRWRYRRGELAGAMFQHGEDRNGNPHLHTHCLVFNLVRTENGRVRPHYQKPLFRWQGAAGATYRNALAWNLRERLGIRMERYGKDEAFTRIAGMPEALIAKWSRSR